MDALYKLNEDLQIPTFRQVGGRQEDIEELARRSSVNVSVDSNPRKADVEAFRKMFEAAIAL